MKFPSRILITLFPALFLISCSQNYNWGWEIVWPGNPVGLRNAQFLIGGLGYTLGLSASAMLCSVLFGLCLALLLLSAPGWLKNTTRVYVEFFRSIPLLVLLLWVYYGLPIMLNLQLNAFQAGVIALAISDSAFEAEIFRGGIQSIRKAQHEAADSLGLSYTDKMLFVILPQALRQILPPLGNQFAYMLKMSSLISVIGLTELTRRANELVVTAYRPLEIYTFLILEYLVLIALVSAGVRWLERKTKANQLVSAT